MTRIPVILACDDRYAVHTGVTLASLLTNAAPQTEYHIRILHAGLQPENVRRLLSLRALSVNAVVEEVNVGRAFATAPQRRALPTATYYRLMAHMIVPEDKLIYLDSDTIVNRDLAELYKIDLGDTYCGGALSPGAREGRIATNLNTGEKVVFLDYLNQLGMPRGIATRFYIQAGTLLINAAKMRADRLEQCFDRVIKNVNYLFAADQDVLNACTGERKTLLDLTWNYQTTLPRVRHQPQVRAWLRGQPEFERQIEKYLHELPAIVHFVYGKPWEARSLGSRYDHLYWHYLRLTPWRSMIRQRFSVTLLRPAYRLFRFVSTAFAAVRRRGAMLRMK